MFPASLKYWILVVGGLFAVALGRGANAAALEVQGHNVELHQDNQSPEEENEPFVEELVEALGSPNFEKRERATTLLKAKDKTFLDELKHIYVNVQDHEIRMRLSEVAEHLICRDVTSKLGGFLGIAPKNVNNKDDPRVRAGQIAVKVSRVVRGCAAEAAGLMKDDLIVEFAGEELRFAYGDRMGFAKLVRSYPPGRAIQFTLLRKNERMVRQVVLGFRPYCYVVEPQERAELEEAQREFAKWCVEVTGLSNTSRPY